MTTSDAMERPRLLYPLFAPISSRPGIGPKLEQMIGKLVRHQPPRIIDLLFLRPLARRDLDAIEAASELREGSCAALDIIVEKHLPSGRSKAPYRILAKVFGIPVELVFFKAHKDYLQRAFPLDQQITVYGKLARYGERWQIAHPEVIPSSGQARHQATTIYPMTDGMTQGRLRALLRELIQDLPDLPEWLPSSVVATHSLPSFKEALRILHGTTEEEATETQNDALRRLALDELVGSQLALQLARQSREQGEGRSLRAAGTLSARLLTELPFSLTNAQQRSLGEIQHDLTHDKPMMRLLMGDVGSGKTVVALGAMLHAIEAKTQSALMAPTEVLARQHFNTIEPLARKLGVRVELLTGEGRSSKKRELLARLEEGESQIAIGTHALFQDGVQFRDLGLAVIDEQHRFGVLQRLELVRKGRAVDVLLMTATPIPRTMVLSAFGDIETSRLDERPAGRKPTTTRILPVSRLDEIQLAIGRTLQQGGRVYWVCPTIESEDNADATAEARYQLLHKRFGDQVGLVHGRMGSEQKHAVMQAFATGDTQLLVATTVIEVGVDVPEATVIVIDGAERFGLAQLHQLRGRVGRGDDASTCLLLYSPPISRTARDRLRIMRETDDGFDIAEEDLRLRGPGEVLGNRQSGVPALIFADLMHDGILLEIARDYSRLALNTDEKLSSEKGRALRLLLHIFERYDAFRLIGAG